jgi:nitrogen fixation NifU-like protein
MFEGMGCTISQAAASVITELLPGKTLAEIQELNSEDLIELLGREVVQSRLRCATLALHTAKAGVRKYQAQHPSLEGSEPERAAEGSRGPGLGLEFE